MTPREKKFRLGQKLIPIISGFPCGKGLARKAYTEQCADLSFTITTVSTLSARQTVRCNSLAERLLTGKGKMWNAENRQWIKCGIQMRKKRAKRRVKCGMRKNTIHINFPHFTGHRFSAFHITPTFPHISHSAIFAASMSINVQFSSV